MPIKTFRGILANNTSEKINLHTRNGAIGYRIKRFSIIQESPGVAPTGDNEGLVQLWSVLPDSSDWQTIDFSSSALIGVGLYTGDAVAHENPNDMIIIFDNVTFNQDIFVTYYDVRGIGDRMNYYLELETVKLDLTENTMATLQDIRNVASNAI